MRRRAAARALVRLRPGRPHAFGCGVPCGPLHRRAGRLHPHQHPWHLCVVGDRQGIQRRPGGQRGLPLSSRFHRRGLRHVGCRRRFFGEQPLPPQLPVFGLQGGFRPSGPGMAGHLWPAGHGHQLLQQLRAVPISGKTHPGHHLGRLARRAGAAIRRRPAGSGLVVR